MNFEAATGYTVLDEDMRTSVLYMYIMQRKPTAWQERTLKIIDNGNPCQLATASTQLESHLVEGVEEEQDDSPSNPTRKSEHPPALWRTLPHSI